MHQVTKEYLTSLIQRDHWLYDYKDRAKEMGVPVITDDVLKLIQVLIESNQVKKILEVGTAIGCSAMFFAEFSGLDGQITTIERHDEMCQKAVDNFNEYGYRERIHCIHGEAQDVLSDINDSFDLIFLDGAKGHYLHMLDDCLRLLRVGGLLVCDNVLFRGMVAGTRPLIRRKITIVKRLRKFLSEISSREDLITSILPIGDGVSISVKKY